MAESMKEVVFAFDETIEEKVTADGELLKPWQRYVLDHFSPGEMFDVPSDLVEVLGDRFASYADLCHDTIHQCGPIASATLSLLFRPKVVVEFGVRWGHTSLLLCKLNPKARVHGVDNESCGWARNVAKTKIAHKIPLGYIAMMNNVTNWSFHIMNSWEFYLCDSVGLCFIDGDHEYDAVLKDSWRAWYNRNTTGDWCIAWDDYHPSNPGVVQAVDEFCKDVGFTLQKAWSWYWIGTKEATEGELDAIRIG